MARTINDAGLQLIKISEGLRTDAYQDVAGIWTIGYGHIHGVQQGTTITEAEATAFLRADVKAAESMVDATTAAVTTSDNAFAAMVSLCFNIGAANFKASSVLRFHLAGDPAAAADAFLLWDKAHVNGALVQVRGLHNRREKERALYLTADD